MSVPLRAGIIGLGMMGRHHARVLRNLEGVRLVGGPMRRATEWTRRTRLPSSSRSTSSSGSASTSRSSRHRQQRTRNSAWNSRPRGCTRSSRKPVAIDSGAAQRLVSAFDRAGLVGAVGHIERYNAALQALRARLDAGELGDVFQIATRPQGPFPNRIADVGVVKDLATHDIDATSWIARSDYASVSAHATTKSGRAHEGPRLGDRSARGRHDHLPPRELAHAVQGACLVVTGSRGSFVADTLTGDLTFHENGTQQTSWDQVAAFRGVTEGSSTRFAIAKREPLVLEHEAFRDAVLACGTTS